MDFWVRGSNYLLWTWADTTFALGRQSSALLRVALNTPDKSAYLFFLWKSDVPCLMARLTLILLPAMLQRCAKEKVKHRCVLCFAHHCRLGGSSWLGLPRVGRDFPFRIYATGVFHRQAAKKIPKTLYRVEVQDMSIPTCCWRKSALPRPLGASVR